MEKSIEQSNGKLITWQPSTQHSRWVAEQLTILAEAMGEAMTPARLKIYAGDLAEIPAEQLQIAFRRALRSCRFFPRIAELRELSGLGNQEQRDDVEAAAAFNRVIAHLEHEGVMAGTSALPERIRYAVRQCGGLWQFNERLKVTYGGEQDPGDYDNRGFSFLQRDFVTAYKAFDVHNAMADEIDAKLSLPEPVRAFLESPKPRMLRSGNERTESRPTTQSQTRRMPEPLTDEQHRARLELLDQQAELLRRKGIN